MLIPEVDGRGIWSLTTPKFTRKTTVTLVTVTITNVVESKVHKTIMKPDFVNKLTTEVATTYPKI